MKFLERVQFWQHLICCPSDTRAAVELPCPSDPCRTSRAQKEREEGRNSQELRVSSVPETVQSTLHGSSQGISGHPGDPVGRWPYPQTHTGSHLCGPQAWGLSSHAIPALLNGFPEWSQSVSTGRALMVV